MITRRLGRWSTVLLKRFAAAGVAFATFSLSLATTSRPTIFWLAPSSLTSKSSALRPGTCSPFLSVTMTGTITRLEPTENFQGRVLSAFAESCGPAWTAGATGTVRTENNAIADVQKNDLLISDLLLGWLLRSGKSCRKSGRRECTRKASPRGSQAAADQTYESAFGNAPRGASQRPCCARDPAAQDTSWLPPAGVVPRRNADPVVFVCLCA